MDEFKGRWSGGLELPKEGLVSLRRLATIESVRWSTRIEGARLTDVEVEKLLLGLEVTPFASRDEEEVAGDAAAIELVLDGWQVMALTESHILGLHLQLMKFSDKNQRHRGRGKNLANHVEGFDTAGNSLGVIFEMATPFETPGQMQALLAWTTGKLEDGDRTTSWRSQSSWFASWRFILFRMGMGACPGASQPCCFCAWVTDTWPTRLSRR